MTKTYEDCKNEVAKKHEFKNWDDANESTDCSYSDLMEMLEEAALLYGEAKFNEGAEEQMRNCCDYAFQAVDAPKPTFKP